MDVRDNTSVAAWSWRWWSWMLVFVAVNAHAALACVRMLQHERRGAEKRRVRCVRKRSRSDLETLSSGIRNAVVFTHTPSTLAGDHKRRRLRRADDCSRAVLQRASLTCPWPVHIAFFSVDIIGDSEKRVASWLAHPLVQSAVATLRDGIESALHEVLVSCLSFVLCAIAVLLLRRYSTLVVGVSVDLGAFSLEV